MPAHEQSVRVHAVWGAGDECGEVKLRADVERGQVAGQYHFDLVNLVRVGFIEHVEGEGVAFFEFVQAGEQAGGWQAGVAGDHGVRGGAADRQRASRKVTNRDLQHAFVGAVVDGEFHFDARHGHVAHDACAGDVERVVVLLLLGGVHVPAVAGGGEFEIVGVGGVEEFFLLRFTHVVGFGHITGHRVGLVHAIPPVGHGWVGDEAKSADKHDDKEADKHVQAAIVFVAFFAALHAAHGRFRRFGRFGGFGGLGAFRDSCKFQGFRGFRDSSGFRRFRLVFACVAVAWCEHHSLSWLEAVWFATD